MKVKIVTNGPVPIWIWVMIHKVRDTYLKKLRNKVLFKAKLDNLTINLRMNSGSSPSGECDNFYTGESITMDLWLNPTYSHKYSAFIVAHEFAHLLLLNISDFTGLSGKAVDGSTNMTALRRINEDGSDYAEYFEEIHADYIAHVIVEDLGFSDKNNQYAAYKSSTQKEIAIAKTFAGVFGPTIDISDYVDAIYANGNMMGNYYWDSIMAFSFNNVINLFDQKMGKDAFKTFSGKIDEYFELEYFDSEADPEESNATYRNVKKTLEDFVKAIYAQEANL